jgi:hypothetical protein
MITAAPVMIPPVVHSPNDNVSRVSSVWPWRSWMRLT